MGEASGDDDFAFAFFRDGFFDGGDGFLFGGFEESAGVDDGDVGLFGVFDAVSLGAEDAGESLRCRLRFGAAEVTI